MHDSATIAMYKTQARREVAKCGNGLTRSSAADMTGQPICQLKLALHQSRCQVVVAGFPGSRVLANVKVHNNQK